MTTTMSHRAVVRRIGTDRYRIERDGRVLGFVEVAEPIYVALHGPDYALAVEVAQTFDGETAARAVLAAEHLALGA